MKRERKRENIKTIKKIVGRKQKIYICEKRIPTCLENSQRLVEEDKKIQRLKFDSIFSTNESRCWQRKFNLRKRNSKLNV